MTSIKNKTNERHGFAFAQFCAVGKCKYVCEFCAVEWGFAFGNAGLDGAGVAKIAKRLQSDKSNLLNRGAEIVFHRVLLIVSGALVTAGIAAKKVYSPGLVCEWFKL